MAGSGDGTACAPALARQTDSPRWRLEQPPAGPCRQGVDTDAVVMGTQGRP